MVTCPGQLCRACYQRWRRRLNKEAGGGGAGRERAESFSSMGDDDDDDDDSLGYVWRSDLHRWSWCTGADCLPVCVAFSGS